MSAPEVYVAVRCDQLDYPVLGSRVILCEWCQCRMWIAPSGIEIVRAREMVLLCQRHAMTRARLLNDDFVVVTPFTPEQLGEVAVSAMRHN